MNINVDTIEDKTVLKAMAYDQISIKETAETNLNVINNRLLQLADIPTVPPSAQVEDDNSTTTTTTTESTTENPED